MAASALSHGCRLEVSALILVAQLFTSVARTVAPGLSLRLGSTTEEVQASTSLKSSSFLLLTSDTLPGGGSPPGIGSPALGNKASKPIECPSNRILLAYFEPHLWWAFGYTILGALLACFLLAHLEPHLWWAFDSSPDNLDG